MLKISSALQYVQAQTSSTPAHAVWHSSLTVVESKALELPQKKHGRILTVKLGAKCKSGSCDIAFDCAVSGRGVPIPAVEVLGQGIY